MPKEAELYSKQVDVIPEVLQEEKFSSQKKWKYLIVTPFYRNNSAGIRVLYELQKHLIRAGYDAKTINEISHTAQDDEIVIYPEIVFGNPLKAKKVVRYILNVPGFIGWG